MSAIGRRTLLLGHGALLAVARDLGAAPRAETVYRFATAEWEVEMSVDFYDRYASSGFWFTERRNNRRFCLSGEGKQNADCLGNFTGSLAVAHYRIRPASGSRRKAALRERVRTIDQDDRLKSRPPFECAIAIRDGIASDLQAFGYEQQGQGSAQEGNPAGPWCFLRQDLFLNADPSPFLVVHWKHTLNEIRILDLIPGDRTRTA